MLTIKITYHQILTLYIASLSFFFYFLALELEARASYVLGKGSTIGTNPELSMCSRKDM